MPRMPFLLLLALATPAAQAHDPVASDGDKYRVVLENDRVRVLAYDDRPGETTRRHVHPSMVVIAIEPFRRRIRLADGRTMERAFRAGDVLYSAGETHVGENVGTTPTRAILVELKDGTTVRTGER
ncbi:MAG TPA: hypothetical protein VEA81_16285 [Burkholderiaceae bacterium]|nr:hypothetical protein [Burkholderiaceae bacterium]